MSKILKIIVNLVVLFSIIIAAALLVPPFAGVDTVMNDNTGTDTNLPVGSVAYGKSVNVRKLEKKDTKVPAPTFMRFRIWMPVQAFIR